MSETRSNNMDKLDSRLKIFQTYAIDAECTMAPADYTVSLLSRTRMTPGAANSGFFETEYTIGNMSYAIVVGLSRRAVGGTNMLRFLLVDAIDTTTKADPVGIVLQGDPLTGSYGGSARNPATLLSQIKEEHSETLENCFRIVGGLFNVFRQTGILVDGRPVHLNRIVQLLSSDTLKLLVGTLLGDPVRGLQDLAARIMNMTGPVTQPLTLAEFVADRGFLPPSQEVLTYLNVVYNGDIVGRAGAWLIATEDQEPDPGHNLILKRNRAIRKYIGYFRTSINNRWIDLDALSGTKAIVSLLRRDRFFHEVWEPFLRRIADRSLDHGTQLMIPLGRGETLLGISIDEFKDDGRVLTPDGSELDVTSNAREI